MTRRKDGLYQEVVTVNGKKKYFYGKTKAEVLRKLRKYEDEQERGVLFQMVAAEWDAEHSANYEYRAHQAYAPAYKAALAEFEDVPLSEITSKKIDLFIRRIAAKGYAKRTVKIYLSLFNLIFNFAILKGYCDNNPASFVKVPAKLPTSKRELPDATDIEKVKSGLSAPFGLYAFFLLYTGCRRGEALALTYDDIDYNEKLIHINKSLYWENNKPVIKSTKTKAGNRTIVLLDVLAEQLPKGKGYVFGGATPLTSTAYRRRWDKYKAATGITLTPHQLRHLFATILYECDIDEKLAQELLGHSSIKVTKDIYTHIRQQHLADAAQKLNEKINM